MEQFSKKMIVPIVYKIYSDFEDAWSNLRTKYVSWHSKYALHFRRDTKFIQQKNGFLKREIKKESDLVGWSCVRTTISVTSLCVYWIDELMLQIHSLIRYHSKNHNCTVQYAKQLLFFLEPGKALIAINSEIVSLKFNFLSTANRV